MSRKILFLALAAVLVLAVLSASVYLVVASPHTVILKEENANQTVELKTGQMLEIHLGGNITTGFSWIEARPVDAAVLESQGDPSYVEDNSNLMGRPGTFIFRYKAAGSGTQVINLSYLQPWDKSVQPEKTYTVTIVVK